MKKYILSIAAIIAASSFAYAALTASDDTAGSADSGAWFTASASGKVTFPDGTTNGPLIQFSPSTNVSLAYGGGDGTIYSLGSYHSSGTKAYATSSVDAKIYMFDLGSPPGSDAVPTTLSTIPVPTGTPLTVTFGDGWSYLK